MIGRLPKSLNINGVDYPIRSDYRDCLLILQAFSDSELTEAEKKIVMLKCLYKSTDVLKEENIQEAGQQAVWFLNCGNTVSKPHSTKPLYDFEQDEQILFSAVNKVAGQEIRDVEYMHFWTFLGLFNEVGDGVFSTVVSIRNKKNKGKKLEKWENEFYRNNKEMIDLKRKYTKEELRELEKLNQILGI